MADSFERFSPNDVCDFVKDQVPNISQDVLDNILQHKIDGEVFLALNDEYLRKIAPLLRDRLKMKRVVSTGFALSTDVSVW